MKIQQHVSRSPVEIRAKGSQQVFVKRRSLESFQATLCDQARNGIRVFFFLYAVDLLEKFREWWLKREIEFSSAYLRSFDAKHIGSGRRNIFVHDIFLSNAKQILITVGRAVRFQILFNWFNRESENREIKFIDSSFKWLSTEVFRPNVNNFI